LVPQQLVLVGMLGEFLGETAAVGEGARSEGRWSQQNPPSRLHWAEACPHNVAAAAPCCSCGFVALSVLCKKANEQNMPRQTPLSNGKFGYLRKSSWQLSFSDINQSKGLTTTVESKYVLELQGGQDKTFYHQKQLFSRNSIVYSFASHNWLPRTSSI